ncbi:Zn-dependent protease [Paucilactobacillus hokkaidonensis]|uniref:Zn-dependent protease n=1 Tax=Paucilactobacillus hokkaidonensis TaxID=1193095 RepID=A0ABR5Q431_9LACO|nr:Zn-dependent protease [Paucilactobacillus hokkaidonensis]
MFFWLALVMGFIFIPVAHKSQLLPITGEIEQYINKVVPNTNSTKQDQNVSQSSSVESTTTTEQTPLESNVEGKRLSSTYYYHFAQGVPQSVKTAFKYAIQTYNQTGVVKLVAGTGTQKQNQITFSTYRKVMSAQQQGTIELGRGGPEIITQVGFGAYTANHAQASLNINYPGLIKNSVAIHELGHALGLAHSSSQRSVMYPIDRGRTTLTDADINGLKKIYDQ